MKHTFQRFWQSRSGASAVEFAIVVPVFLLMLFAMIEFSRLFWTAHALHNVAISTARCMGVPQLECEDGGVYSAAKAKAFAQETAAAWFVSLDLAAITLDRDAGCHELVEGFSQAVITHQFVTALPGLLVALAGGTNLKAEACFTNH